MVGYSGCLLGFQSENSTADSTVSQMVELMACSRVVPMAAVTDWPLVGSKAAMMDGKSAGLKDMQMAERMARRSVDMWADLTAVPMDGSMVGRWDGRLAPTMVHHSAGYLEQLKAGKMEMQSATKLAATMGRC